MGDNETWGEFPGDDAYPSTGAMLENVSLSGEDEVGVLLPESMHDRDHLSNLRHRQAVDATRLADEERGKEFRAKKRRDRYNAVLERFVQFVEDWKLMPESWLERSTESGERHPRFVGVIRNGFSRWWRSAGAALSAIASFLWIMQWLLGAPSVVMHDGTNVVNLWAPSTVHVLDLTLDSASAWITANRAEATAFKMSHLNDAYFDAHIYYAKDNHNVTMEWFAKALHDACPHDSANEEDRCVCMPSVEIGVMANAIYMDDTLMLNPYVTKQDGVRIPYSYDGGGTKALQSAAIVVEFMNRGGQIERRKAKLHRASCIARSLDLVGLLHGT